MKLCFGSATAPIGFDQNDIASLPGRLLRAFALAEIPLGFDFR